MSLKIITLTLSRPINPKRLIEKRDILSPGVAWRGRHHTFYGEHEGDKCRAPIDFLTVKSKRMESIYLRFRSSRCGHDRHRDTLIGAQLFHRTFPPSNCGATKDNVFMPHFPETPLSCPNAMIVTVWQSRRSSVRNDQLLWGTPQLYKQGCDQTAAGNVLLKS